MWVLLCVIKGLSLITVSIVSTPQRSVTMYKTLNLAATETTEQIRCNSWKNIHSEK